jgi:hypothetical protein
MVTAVRWLLTITAEERRELEHRFVSNSWNVHDQRRNWQLQKLVNQCMDGTNTGPVIECWLNELDEIGTVTEIHEKSKVDRAHARKIMNRFVVARLLEAGNARQLVKRGLLSEAIVRDLNKYTRKTDIYYSEEKASDVVLKIADLMLVHQDLTVKKEGKELNVAICDNCGFETQKKFDGQDCNVCNSNGHRGVLRTRR